MSSFSVRGFQLLLSCAAISLVGCGQDKTVVTKKISGASTSSTNSTTHSRTNLGLNLRAQDDAASAQRIQAQLAAQNAARDAVFNDYQSAEGSKNPAGNTNPSVKSKDMVGALAAIAALFSIDLFSKGGGAKKDPAATDPKAAAAPPATTTTEVKTASTETKGEVKAAAANLDDRLACSKTKMDQLKSDLNGIFESLDRSNGQGSKG